MGESDTGRKSTGWSAGRKGRGWSVRPSTTGQKDIGDSDMGQIKDEGISKVEALPNPLGAPPDTPSFGVCTPILLPLYHDLG